MILFGYYYFLFSKQISPIDCIVYSFGSCVFFCLTFKMSTAVIRANCQHSSTCHSELVFIDATTEIPRKKYSKQTKNEFLVQGNSKRKYNGRDLWILF